jgi:tetratricopeptide (TPR) repeat protein
MDLAELTFQANMFPEAREEFEKAVTLAENIPEARANALYSAAVLSEEIEDYERAHVLLKRFHAQYLRPSIVRIAAKMNSRYLVTPLKLAELSRKMDNEGEQQEWLKRGEELYEGLAGDVDDPALLKELRFNLLATFLQMSRWQDSLDLLGELREEYGSGEDQAAILFLEAKIMREGLNRLEEAFGLFRRVYEEHENSPDAPSALLSAAATAKQLGRTEEAEQLYKLVVKKYRSVATAAVRLNGSLA